MLSQREEYLRTQPLACYSTPVIVLRDLHGKRVPVVKKTVGRSAYQKICGAHREPDRRYCQKSQFNLKKSEILPEVFRPKFSDHKECETPKQKE